jgi:hypothetical protein
VEFDCVLINQDLALACNEAQEMVLTHLDGPSASTDTVKGLE